MLLFQRFFIKVAALMRDLAKGSESQRGCRMLRHLESAAVEACGATAHLWKRLYRAALHGWLTHLLHWCVCGFGRHTELQKCPFC